MLQNDQIKKIKAANRLLTEKTTTIEKFEAIRTLVKGIDPRIDKRLSSCSKAIKKLKRVQKGEIIELSAEVLPEKTEEQKKRKKAVLLFIKYWKQLRAEVKRLIRTYESQRAKETTRQQKLINISKILTSLKGPLGLISLLAAVIASVVIFLNTRAVSAIIKNTGCDPIKPPIQMPFAIPGFKLPQQEIPTGGQGEVKSPPFRFLVDGTEKGIIKLTVFKLTKDFELKGKITDLLFNGRSLLGQRTLINLGAKPQNELVIICK